PLSPNGKIDRKQISMLVGSVLGDHRRVTPPRSSAEKALAKIWEDLLGCGPVGVDDSFFDLGGHSLVIARLLSRIADRFGISLSVQSVLQLPSLSALAAAIEKEQHTPAEPQALAEPVDLQAEAELVSEITFDAVD